MKPVSADMLMAYVDGQLDAADRQLVETHLAGAAEAGAEVAQMQRQSDAIRTLYGPVLSEPVPAHLAVTSLRQARARARNAMLGGLAAALVLFTAGLFGGWTLRSITDAPAMADRLIADAVSAHTVYVLEKRHAVEVDGAETDHLASWLSNRLQTNLAMPDLSGAGLAFLGGRLLPAPEIPGGRAAQLMYEDESGARLTLYITPAPATALPRYELASLGLDTALFWSDAVLTCTITAPYPAEQLQAIARAVFAQLNPYNASYDS